VINMAEPGSDAWGGHHTLLERWRRWTGHAHWLLLSHHQGHIVQQMDQLLLMEFADPRRCLPAAFALHQLADSMNADADANQRLRLRAAAHLTGHSPGEREPADQDGRLTIRLSALARPGDVLITAPLRDRLAHGPDADLEDCGEWVGLDQRVRLFRAHPRPEHLCDGSTAAHGDPRPGLAIMPFRADAPQTMPEVIGELIAEGVISRLSRSIGLRVIARQSTSALRCSSGLGAIESHLGATYVMSGRYRVRNRQLIVTAELAVARNHALLWKGELRQPLDDLLEEQSELLHGLAHTVARHIGNAQAGPPLARPLPSLDSSHLMLAGISMGYSHSGGAFERGREALTELITRHPRLAPPRAWLGLWHALNVVQGKSRCVAGDVRQAREQTQRALDVEPDNAMALAVEGYIQCQLLGNPRKASKCLDSAIEANPSEPMAWLLRSLYSSMWDSSAWAVTEANFACSLSPVDPLQYFFDLLRGNAFLADHQPKQAIACGRKSLRALKHHVPALRLLLTAQAESGHISDGKDTVGELLIEMPDLTVSSYLSMGSEESPMRQRMALAMRQLGLPEN
jgi:adenylate cyclase